MFSIATFGYAIYNTVTDTYVQENAVDYGDIKGAGILSAEDEIITASTYLYSDELLVGVVREQQNTKRIDCTPIAPAYLLYQQSTE